jgi:tetratricopeptide (TPR) repeat protein
MNKTLGGIALGVALSVLTACGGMAQRPVTSTATNPPASQESALPAVALSPDILFDMLLGEIAGQRGQLDVALASLRDAALKSRDPRLVERATLVGLYAKRPAESLDTARLWVELQPTNLDAREALGIILMETGDTRGAQQQMEKILALSPGDQLAQGYLRVSATLGRQQNRDAALGIMQSLVNLHPDNPEALFALAHLAVRVGNLTLAATSIDRALSLRPEWEDAALFKTRVLASQKDMQKVIEFNEAFLARYPRSNNLRMNYARYLVDLKQWDKARTQFKQVLAISPKDPDALYAVGLLALQSNLLDEARKYLTLNLEVQPENDQARLYLGQVAEQRKLYDEAAKWYREVSPGNLYFDAQSRLSLVIAQQGDLAGGRKLLHSLEAENEQQQVQIVLTEEQMLREAKQPETALQVLTAALKDMPDNADLLYARALVAERLGKLDLHESDLRKVLRKDPKNAHALNALGYTLADRTTRYQESLELLEQALALKPDDPFIMDSMGWVQYRLGHHTEAVKYLKSALEKRPDAEIAAHLGEVLWVIGDKAGAESVWSRALKATPDNEVLMGVIKKFKP